jgi:hypothetical protein
MIAKLTRLAAGLAAILAVVPALGAAVLPAGTHLEVRLSVATGSRVSHAGDRIEASLIAPVFQENRLIFPQGTKISGAVQSVDRLGFGIKHCTASLEYQFDSVELPDGRAFPVKTRVREVETARERVGESGIISGISPTASLSSGAAVVISALVAEPQVAAPVLGIKFLIARSPDAEIYFPAGTEVVLEVLTEVALPNFSTAQTTIAPLSPEEVANTQYLLKCLHEQHTDNGPNHPSDLVNILLLGSHDRIDRAFRAAGWAGEQRHSVLALYRMFHSAVQRTGYGMAPMTRLTLNGMTQDASYQKSLDTFSKRHHIRLWKQHGSDAWLGAATEDVTYVVRRMHVTHATDPEIDNERAKVVNDLWFTGCVEAGSLIARDSLKTTDKEGISAATDGSLAVLRLNDCRTVRAAPPVFARPGPSPRNRLVQAIVAVGNDIARSNPVSLSYNAAKSLWMSSSFKGEKLGILPDSSHQEAGSSETLARHRWQRASALDIGAEMPPSRHDHSPALNAAATSNSNSGTQPIPLPPATHP